MFDTLNIKEKKNIDFEYESKSSLVLSICFHIFVIILLGINFHLSNKISPKQNIYTVEIVPISLKTNIKEKSKSKDNKTGNTATIKSSPKIKHQKDPNPVKQDSQKNKKIVNNDTKSNQKKNKTTTNKNKPNRSQIKNEKTQEVKNKQDHAKEKNNDIDEDFDSLMKTLEKNSSAINDNKVDVGENPAKGPYDEKFSLSISLEDDIRRQIEQCWTPPAGGLDAGKLNILLHITLKQDGTVNEVKVLEKYGSNNLRMLNAATDAAVRAVRKCSPLENLPVAQYDSWKELEFNFDPSQIIY